jgi:hypothetical protein
MGPRRGGRDRESYSLRTARYRQIRSSGVGGRASVAATFRTGQWRRSESEFSAGVAPRGRYHWHRSVIDVIDMRDGSPPSAWLPALDAGGTDPATRRRTGGPRKLPRGESFISVATPGSPTTAERLEEANTWSFAGRLATAGSRPTAGRWSVPRPVVARPRWVAAVPGADGAPAPVERFDLPLARRYDRPAERDEPETAIA